MFVRISLRSWPTRRPYREIEALRARGRTHASIKADLLARDDPAPRAVHDGHLARFSRV